MLFSLISVIESIAALTLFILVVVSEYYFAAIVLGGTSIAFAFVIKVIQAFGIIRLKRNTLY